MTPGKMCSQAGHAFLDTYEQCREDDPDRACEYSQDGHGTKVVLHAKNLDAMLELHHRAKAEGLPCALIEDTGHVMPPHFDGSPTVTALGIGPATREEINHLTRRLALVN